MNRRIAHILTAALVFAPVKAPVSATDRQLQGPCEMITVPACSRPFDAGELPPAWSKDVRVVYQEGGSIFWGNFTFRIGGDGTVIARADTKNRIDAALANGRTNFRLTRPELDYLLSLLRQLNIDRLRQYDGKGLYTDGQQISLFVKSGDKHFFGHFTPTLAHQAVEELKTIFIEFINSALTARSLRNTDRNYIPIAGRLPPRFIADIKPLRTISDLSHYRHSFAIAPMLKGSGINCVNLEIRRKRDNLHIATIPFEQGLEDFISREEITSEVSGLAGMDPNHVPDISPEPGLYLVRLYINGCAQGHAAPLEIRSGSFSNLQPEPAHLNQGTTDKPTDLDVLWTERPLRFAPAAPR